MGKAPYYIGRTVQATGLLLILHAWVVSIVQEASMNFMFSFTGTGMAIFMAGWMIQKLF
jgi:hypothetical protein